jgi:hypothetical protein
VVGTVGADDNASAMAVMMETARAVQEIAGIDGGDLEITFVAFALEESPTYGTHYMGSRSCPCGPTFLLVRPGFWTGCSRKGFYHLTSCWPAIRAVYC